MKKGVSVLIVPRPAITRDRIIPSRWYMVTMEGKVKPHKDCQGPDKCKCWRKRKR